MTTFLDAARQFAMEAGPVIFLQALLAIVILVLTYVNIIRLAQPGGRRPAGLDTSIDAILFWGSLTAIFGFFGQWNGLYRAANALHDYGLANPAFIVKGVGESASTAVFGMFTLVVSAFLWFALRVVQNRRAAT